MAQNVLYLPPGVVPMPPMQATGGPTGVPFDRDFFEKILPPAIDAFCKQVQCEVPLVQLMTVDGTRHFVNGISGVSDSWVALQTSEEGHKHPTQVFLPYQTIFRVEIHPETDTRRQHLGFVISQPVPALPKPPSKRAAAKK